MATRATLQRARFEQSRPAAIATMLSSRILQAIACRGPEWADYVTGIAGRGRRWTHVAVCRLGATGCLAIPGRVAARA